MIHKPLCQLKALYRGMRQTVFVFAKSALADSHKASRTRMVFIGLLRDPIKPGIGGDKINAIGFECINILANDGSFGILQDLEEIVDDQFLAADDHRQSTHKFRFESVFNKIVALGKLKIILVARDRSAGGAESNGLGAQAPANDIRESGECAADDKQDVTGVDDRAVDLPLGLEFHRRLQL